MAFVQVDTPNYREYTTEKSQVLSDSVIEGFQTIDNSTPQYFCLKRLIKVTDLCISGCVL